MFKKISFVLLLFLAAQAFAQVPPLINYQGTLVDPVTGDGLNGSYSMTFSIYATETGGTALWTETQTVAVQDGLFSVLLGSSTAIPLNLFDETTRYLGVKVGTDPEMTPRQRLVSVGYAFKANDADNFSGKETSDFVQAGQANSISTGMIQEDAVTAAKISPAVVSSVDGVTNDGGDVDLVAGSNVTITPNDEANTITISATPGGGGDNLGDHTATQNVKLNNHWLSGDGGSEGVFVKADGKVGIGMNAPAYLLDVMGAINTASSGFPGKSLRLFSSSDQRVIATNDLTFRYADAGGNGLVKFVENGQERLTIKNGGNVGIGTTTPAQKLDVNGTVQMTGFKLSTGAAAGRVLTSDVSGVGAWQTLAAGGDITAVTAGNGLSGGGVSGDVTLDVGAGTGITVNANDVALNTTYTDGQYVNENQANSISNAMLQNNAVSANQIQPNIVSSVDGVTNDGGDVDLVAGTNITITPDDANNRITIAASASGDNLGNHTATQNIRLNGNWLSGDGGSEGVFVANDGKVGIGTTSPGYKLHIVSTSANDQIRFEAGGTNANPSLYIKAIDPNGGHAQIFMDRHSDWCESAVNFYNSGTKKWRITMPDRTTGAGDRLDVQSSTTSVMTFLQNGKIGIGTKNPGNILSVVQSSATDPIADAWTIYSSRRWKTNITVIDDALDRVQKLRGVFFDWKADGKHDIGLIAEEVGEIVPEVVAYEENGIDAKSVDYSRLVAVLIEAVKQQQKMLSDQQSEIDALKEKFKLQH